MKHLASVFILLCVSFSAHADIEYTYDTIKTIAPYFGRVVIEKSSPHNKNCGSGSNDKASFELSKDNEDFDQIYAILLAAKMSKSYVTILSETAVCKEHWGTKRLGVLALVLT